MNKKFKTLMKKKQKKKKRTCRSVKESKQKEEKNAWTMFKEMEEHHFFLSELCDSLSRFKQNQNVV